MAKGQKWTKLLVTLQLTNDRSQAPAGLKWRSNQIFILATITAALYSDLFLYSLIVPVLPFLLRDQIGIPANEIQTHVSALVAIYAAASMICSPVLGFLADRLATRQAPFFLGLGALLASTVMFFLAQSLPIVYVARVLQGISAGVVWTIGLALCLETVGSENYGKAVGTIFGIVSSGNMIAPILGGVLYEKIGYKGVFGVGCAILAVDLIMRALMIEKRVAAEYPVEALDEAAGSATANADDQIGSHDESGSQPNDQNVDGERQPLLGAAGDGAVPDNGGDDDKDFIISDDLPAIARKFPILACLADPRLLSAFILALIQALLYGSYDATIPTVAQEFFNFSSLEAGLLFVIMAVCDLFFAPLFGWAIDRYGTKVVAVGGYALLIPVHVLLRLPHAGGRDQVALYAALLGLAGIGLSGISGIATVESGALVDRFYKANPGLFGERKPNAQLYGLNNMLFNLGLTIGPELAGELKIKIGYGNMNLVIAGICLAALLLSLFYIGGRLKVGQRKTS